MFMKVLYIVKVLLKIKDQCYFYVNNLSDKVFKICMLLFFQSCLCLWVYCDVIVSLFIMLKC